MTLRDIVAELGRLKGQGAWSRIAKEANVDYFTVARIARGEFKNPGVLTCERIADAIAHEQRHHGRAA